MIRKMPEFYMIIAEKYFSKVWVRHIPSLPPSPTRSQRAQNHNTPLKYASQHATSNQQNKSCLYYFTKTVTQHRFRKINIQKLEILREYRPPPNATIIELLTDFCNAN